MRFNINNTSKFRGSCVTIPTSSFSFLYYYYPEGRAGGAWEFSCKVMLFLQTSPPPQRKQKCLWSLPLPFLSFTIPVA